MGNSIHRPVCAETGASPVARSVSDFGIWLWVMTLTTVPALHFVLVSNWN